MTELDPSKIPTQPNRSFNLLLMMFLVAVTGIVLYYFLDRHYNPSDAQSGDPELAQFELDAQIKSLQPVLEAMELYYGQNQAWPIRLDQLELDGPVLSSFPGLSLGNKGELSFSGSEALGEFRNGSLHLTPEGTPGQEQFNWRCSATGIAEDYLPEYCRAPQ